MDKINIVSSQAVGLLQMFSISVDTSSMSSSPLVNSLVKNRLFKTAPDIDKPPFQLIHTMDLSIVNTMLHDSPDLVIQRTEIWAVWRPQVGRKKVWRFLTWQFNCCTYAARCAGALSCWNTKSWPDTLRIAGSSMTSWNSIEEVSKRYHQNFLLCNNNKITACIADFIQWFLWRNVCGCIFQGSAAINYRWSGKFSYVFVDR